MHTGVSMSEITDRLTSLANKIAVQGKSIETEEATKNAFVMPFISLVLGYDVFNPNEVVPEFTADVGTKRGEKIDYAIVKDGSVQILIECKKLGAPLGLNQASQLFRYFAVANARVAILTDGDHYHFYTDLDAPNRMDAKPFLVLQLSDLDDTLVPEIQKLTKDTFDIESIVNAAEELKYIGAIKRVLSGTVRHAGRRLGSPPDRAGLRQDDHAEGSGPVPGAGHEGAEAVPCGPGERAPQGRARRAGLRCAPG